MALAFCTARAPAALASLRSVSRSNTGLPPRAFFIQTRGKKIKPNRHHMQIVKLLQNVTGYGPKGAVMAVPPGLMRNYWYPGGLAQYVTGADLKETKRSPAALTTRDFGYGKVKTDEIIGADEDIVKVDAQLLSPQRSEQLLQTLLPEYIEFFRAPISAVEQSKMQIPEAEIATRQIQPQAIFGSVSTQDILQNIRELLTLKAAEKANADAGRVVLQASDIKLVKSEISTDLEDDRIKFLGDFEFVLHVRGGGSVRRKVRVSAQT